MRVPVLSVNVLVAQSCPTLYNPIKCSLPGSLLLLSRFSRVRLCDPIDGRPTRLPCPWDSPGKYTGVGCHFLLHCMKVESQSEVAQLCLTLSDLMDCSPPGSIHGIFQARVNFSHYTAANLVSSSSQTITLDIYSGNVHTYI